MTRRRCLNLAHLSDPTIAGATLTPCTECDGGLLARPARRYDLVSYRNSTPFERAAVDAWLDEHGIKRAFQVEEGVRGEVWVQHYDDPPVLNDIRDGGRVWLRMVEDGADTFPGFGGWGE